MEEAAKYEECTKEELIQIILELQRLVREQGKRIEELQRSSKPEKPKDSSNSSIPTSKEIIPRTKSQREKSGKKSGGQIGHKGYHRERNANPDRIVQIEAKECKKCGVSLEEIEGTIGQRAQEVDIPQIKPLTTEYQQVIKRCACGEWNSVPLPIEGYVNIGPQMGALITYCNVEHALPYERLSQISHDLLGFSISEGTIENKLIQMQKQSRGLVERIKKSVISAKWIGSDETGSKVGGRRYWNWVWQSPLWSYFVIVPSRGYAVVKANFTESYLGVLGHDCWSAQNNTPAGAHQLCHAHLLRNLQYALDAERSIWAYRMQQLLRKSQRARDAIWQPTFSPPRREAVICFYKQALGELLKQSLGGKEERRLQKRLIKYQDWIFTFMSYPDVPPDNNSSERAIKAAKLKENVSGGFRSSPGATRFAQLLSVTQTLRKHKLPILPSLTAIFLGRSDTVPFPFSSA